MLEKKEESYYLQVLAVLYLENKQGNTSNINDV